MTPLRVSLAPTEPESVFNVRTRWFAEALRDRGEIEIVPLPSVLDVTEHHNPDGSTTLTKLKSFPEVDVLVVTRVLAQRIAQLIPLVQARGVAVLLNIDDDFKHLPPLMGGASKINPRLNPRYNFHWYVEACRAADFVVVSTPALQKYAPGKCQVIRNAVPEAYLDIKVPHHHIKTVGWGGTKASHAGDLEVTRGGVAKALFDLNARFLVVGDAKGVGRAIGLPHDPPDTGLLDHTSFPYYLAQLDVGIAPLANNTYNAAKSWLAPLTLASLGVPFVASGSEEYKSLVSRLPESPSAVLEGHQARKWRRAVIQSLTMPEDEREDATRSVKDTIRRELTVEATGDAFLEALEETVRRRKVPTLALA